ncbi:MAG: HAMP domain-containing sensor histidine kinase [Nannocystaceae bacterium]
MRRHLLIALIAMVVGPLALLAALAGKMLHDEEDLVRHRFRELLEQRLDDSRSAVTEVVGELEVELVQALEATAADREALRAFERGQPLVRQVFVVDADGRRLHPRADADASADEREFLERTRAIWEAKAELARVGPAEGGSDAYANNTWTLPPSSSGSLLSSSGGSLLAEAQQASKAKIAAARDSRAANEQAQQAYGWGAEDAAQRGGEAAQQQAVDVLQDAGIDAEVEAAPAADSLAGLARIREQGWIAWYWEEGLHLLFWRRRADGLIAGAEIERAALLQRLIDSLPATGEQSSLIAVADAKGAPIYQWGIYEPADDEEPRARLLLAPPLESWSLLYYGPADAPIALTTSRFLVVVGLGGTALVLLGLAAFFYREWSRNMRDARQRVSFVTQVSHELKTPLTNIRLYAELLADELEGLDDRAEEHAGVIVSESQRLSRLIANVLTFSRRGRPASARRPLDVEAAIRQTIEHFGPAFAERGIAVRREGAAPRPVIADEDALGQILANLLSNVEKYASAGARVDVDLEQDAAKTRIRVRDYGPGIPAAQRRKVFDPFFRARSDLTEGVSGTGIGLTIARDLARQCGGELDLEPCEPGACFVLTLPTGDTPEATPDGSRGA